MGFSKLFERHESASSQEVVGGNGDGHTSSTDVSVIHDGGLAYTVAKAENGSKPSWQEAIGAPVESRSPLGYHVGWLTVIFLNVNQMIGTGVFSTRKADPQSGIKFNVKLMKITLTRVSTLGVLAGSILNSTGSVGLALIYWFIGFLMAAAGVCVFLELASYFPNRSGAEVVYLEQAYPRPKHFFPIAFAVQSVVLSFSSSNAIGKHVSR